MSLIGGRSGGEAMKYYIATSCRPQAQPTTDGKINIKDVTKSPLRTILFMITRLAGSSTLHVACRSYMQYGVECLEPTIFNQSKGVLVNMKEHLTKEREGKLKNLSYGSILVSFSLERVPLLQPQQIILEPIDLTAPQMRRLIDHMDQHVGPSEIKFSPTFFGWMRRQFIIINDYPQRWIFVMILSSCFLRVSNVMLQVKYFNHLIFSKFYNFLCFLMFSRLKC